LVSSQQGAILTITEQSSRAAAALCLSGGGYRAMAFHTGVLWRLNELGCLEGLGRISAVSGGALLAGRLAAAWPSLEFDQKGKAVNFEEEVVRPVRTLMGISIALNAFLLGLLPWRSGNGELARFFNKYLCADIDLGQLPSQPDFVFCATDVRHGSLWRFGRDEMGNDQSGWYFANEVPLCAAISASAAFPPFYAPSRLDLRPHPHSRNFAGARFTTAVLSDGGVYDDLALEPAATAFSNVLVSDASEELPVVKQPSSNWLCQLIRVRQTAMAQVRLQRLARARESFPGQFKDFGLTAALPPDAQKLPGFDETCVKRLVTLPSKFVRLDQRTQMDLINWGYAICAANMHEAGAAKIPYPSA